MSGVHEALVVGGGLAGAAFATRLAQAGRDVVLVERESGPHDKVCGEFLSHEALHYLERLDVSPARLGAVPIERVLLGCGRSAVSRPLPFRAASLSRRVLDEAVLLRAKSAGARIMRGSSVARLERAGDVWSARLSEGDKVMARQIALACGKHDLRGQARPQGVQNDLIGMKAHFRLSPSNTAALQGTVAIGLFPGGYAGLELVEGGVANLCLVVRRSAYAALGRRWTRLLDHLSEAAPALGRMLDSADSIDEKPLAIAHIPYGYVRRTGDDIWRLGDQAAVIPSFCGEGMSLALHSGNLGATQFLAGAKSDVFQNAFARDVTARVRAATWVSRAIVARPAQYTAIAAARMMSGLLPAFASATRLPWTAIEPGR